MIISLCHLIIPHHLIARHDMAWHDGTTWHCDESTGGHPSGLLRGVRRLPGVGVCRKTR